MDDLPFENNLIQFNWRLLEDMLTMIYNNSLKNVIHINY